MKEKPRMSNWYRNRLTSLTTTLGVVACGVLGVVGAGTATAGTNGQHISYYSRSAYAQCTTGRNQNGDNVQNCTQLSPGHNLDEGYWWVGPVGIIWDNSDGSRVSSTCNVPKSQEGDSFTCHEPS